MAVTELARQVIVHYYGQQWKKSYFMGCSNGGRQACSQHNVFGSSNSVQGRLGETLWAWQSMAENSRTTAIT